MRTIKFLTGIHVQLLDNRMVLETFGHHGVPPAYVSNI